MQNVCMDRISTKLMYVIKIKHYIRCIMLMYFFSMMSPCRSLLLFLLSCLGGDLVSIPWLCNFNFPYLSATFYSHWQVFSSEFTKPVRTKYKHTHYFNMMFKTFLIILPGNQQCRQSKYCLFSIQPFYTEKSWSEHKWSEYRYLCVYIRIVIRLFTAVYLELKFLQFCDVCNNLENNFKLRETLKLNSCYKGYCR